jgi:hypothetical protein
VLPTSNDFDDLEAVAGLELALRKFRGRYGFAVMFNNDAARQEILGGQKLFERAWQLALDAASVGDDD